MLNNLNFRRVQSSDLKEIIKLFEVVFKKKISKKFYKWRYFNKSYTSFIALKNKKIIAHIGFIQYRLDNNSNYVFSRHSTFVLQKFQKKGVYYKLLNYSFSILKNKSDYIIAWPNKKNLEASQKHSNFNIVAKYDLYIKNFYSEIGNKFFKKIDHVFLKKLKFDQKNNIFFKDKKYINWRYNDYKKDHFYFLDFKPFKKFIFQKNNSEKKSNFNIIDYYGKYNNYDSDLRNLILFLIYKKISFQLLLPVNYRRLNYIFQKRSILNKDRFYIGLYSIGKSKVSKLKIEKKIKNVIKISDTDVFIKTF